jgi:hypothetical protein
MASNFRKKKRFIISLQIVERMKERKISENKLSFHEMKKNYNFFAI